MLEGRAAQSNKAMKKRCLPQECPAGPPPVAPPAPPTHLPTNATPTHSTNRLRGTHRSGPIKTLDPPLPQTPATSLAECPTAVPNQLSHAMPRGRPILDPPSTAASAVQSVHVRQRSRLTRRHRCGRSFPPVPTAALVVQRRHSAPVGVARTLLTPVPAICGAPSRVLEL